MRAALRARLRAEHHHPDFEVRVVAGDDVYRLDCADGDGWRASFTESELPDRFAPA